MDKQTEPRIKPIALAAVSPGLQGSSLTAYMLNCLSPVLTKGIVSECSSVLAERSTEESQSWGGEGGEEGGGSRVYRELEDGVNRREVRESGGGKDRGGERVEVTLLGVAFLGIGLWAWSEKGVLSNISSITDMGGFDPVWLFIVVGGVMFILGFAGCIGALRENTFLLKFFSVFLGIIFFLELTAGVLAFVFKDWIKDQLNFFINNNIRAYRDDIDLQNLIDFTQEYWECCGAFGADDWNLNIYFNCTDSNASRERCGVPFSCCTKDPAEDVINTQCGYDVRAKVESEQQNFIYIKGCVPQFEKWLQDNLTVVAGIFIGVALLQVRGVCSFRAYIDYIDL
ncbi:UNVERIFIED_CONTAM: hypothetical protein FKN15_070010 [Acipenser sinensis]